MALLTPLVGFDRGLSTHRLVYHRNWYLAPDALGTRPTWMEGSDGLAAVTQARCQVFAPSLPTNVGYLEVVGRLYQAFAVPNNST